MTWYDTFSNFYDTSLERLYAEHRQLAAAALQLDPAARILDIPCGTGQSFAALSAGLGAEGKVLGVDVSRGMIAKAEARIKRDRLGHVQVRQASAAEIDHAAIGGTWKDPHTRITHLHVFLGMSVFREMDETFEHLWGLLDPGGRCVLVDVHAAQLGVQGWLVNQIAGADIRRHFWEPLEKRAAAFERRDLPYSRQHGGQIMLAVGVKP
jgi:ubiquinone/menaquinone biosynthesis C-methylase UbiE